MLNDNKTTMLDKLIVAFDRSLRALLTVPISARANPAQSLPENELNLEQQKHVIGLLRVDHTGEICAQALYQGQALFARNKLIQTQLLQASEEEQDHLQWCHQRLQELNGRTSYLNPLWYAGSFAMGVFASLMGDQYSLGFLAETERQVSKHLEDHLQQLPEQDKKSAAILQQMHTDESEHASTAIKNGAIELPDSVKWLMRRVSKVMTKTAYWI